MENKTNIEIERKFLLKDDSWKSMGVFKTINILQGYLSQEPVLRIRKSEQGTFLAVKGKGAGLARPEFEYPIPEADFHQMIELAYGKIEKTRYHLNYGKHMWEIDVFHGKNEGLLIAEVEMSSLEDIVELPPFVGKEVTEDFHYTNAFLARTPFSKWSK